jgi:hypothetical protein
VTSTGVLPTRNDSATSPKNDMLEPGVLFRLDYVAGIEGDVGDGPNATIEGRQNSDSSPRDASDSPQAKAGTARSWFAGAMQRMFVLVARGLVYAGGK